MYGWSKEVIGNIIIKVMSVMEVFLLNMNPFISEYESVKTNPLQVAELFERNPYTEINLVGAQQNTVFDRGRGENGKPELSEYFQSWNTANIRL